MPLFKTETGPDKTRSTGFTDSDIRERLEYLQLSEGEFETLRQFHDLTDGEVSEIVGKFYEHLVKFPDVADMVGDELVLKKLLRTLQQHLLSLGTDAHEPSYFEKRHKIGVVHEALGLSLQSYLGAYSCIFNQYAKSLQNQPDLTPEALVQMLTTLFKIISLDTIIVTESYYDATTNRLGTLLSELGAAQDKLEELSRTDDLTKLSNRRYFFESVEVELSRCERHDRGFVLMMLDLDHFKNLNDTHGHQCGDEVLRCVAKVVRETLRPMDLVGRYGGEEFAIGLVESDIKTAVNIADRLRQRISETPVKYGDIAVTVSASIGVAALGKDEELENLVRRADAALYDAKAQGRNRVALAKDSAA